MTPLPDPRDGDAEDDASSTKSRSLLAIAGSLLAEVSLPKLALAWGMLILLPALALGVAPILAAAWVTTVWAKLAALAGIGSLAVLGVVAAVGWFGGRPLFRMAERAFWSLNSVAVQPAYALCREALRHAAEAFIGRDAAGTSATATTGGLLTAALALGAVALAWPATRWGAAVVDLAHPMQLLRPALANMVVLLGGYCAAASLAWGLADATMGQPRDLGGFDTAPPEARRWRVAHLSDLHAVGERFGFRIESGRLGPRGNDRMERLFARLDAIHAEAPLDLALITGDMTDAGRSTEWAEFRLALAAHPALAARTLMLPGNHDIAIVDRANPARLELPGSPAKRLRQMRALIAMEAVQGARVRVLDASGAPGPTLSDWLAPHRTALAAFADSVSLRGAFGLSSLWAEAFPMVLPPDGEEGLGVVLLNSNAETHFSFTNALGLVSAEDARRMLGALAHWPRARWIVALHHHLVEYPRPATAFSERIGTALVNGSWLVRQLRAAGPRLVVMHGHRHVDWVGACAGLRIISAPSPVMEQGAPAYIHRLAATPGGVALEPPQQVREI
jgi:3',5'-cyclic AMP phosphodiesterase CpdA